MLEIKPSSVLSWQTQSSLCCRSLFLSRKAASSFTCALRTRYPVGFIETLSSYSESNKQEQVKPLPWSIHTAWHLPQAGTQPAP